MACLTGSGIITLLSSCSPLPVFKTSSVNNKIQIPISLFENTPVQVIKVRNMDYDIAVEKLSTERFRALLMRCTHADAPLSVVNNGFLCNRHGSKFSAGGEVIKGPAEERLVAYKTAISNDVLIIHL